MASQGALGRSTRCGSFPLMVEVFENNKNNFQILNDLLEIAKLADDLLIKELALREMIEMNPDNIEYQIDLAKALVKLYNRSSGHKSPTKARKNSRLREAEKILLNVLKKEPHNLETLRFLMIIASLQKRRSDEEMFTKLMANIDPNYLDNKKIIAQNNHIARQSHSANENNDKSPQTDVLGSLQVRLTKELNKGWNPTVVADILHLMLAEENLNNEDRKKIKSMLDKTKSTKIQKLFAIRAEAESLFKK